jgi:glycosyltransferase involved in cell wall biosynthesis
MRITVDLSAAVHRRAGLGTYAQELLSALVKLDGRNEYCAFYHDPGGAARPAPPLQGLARTPVPLGAKPWRMAVLLAYFARMEQDRWVPAGDVFHATDHLLPRLEQSAGVFTLHDLSFRLCPEYHLPLNRWYLSLMLPRFMRRADAVIAISENTRRDLVRLMDIPAEKISVIHAGVSSRFRPLDDPDEVARVRAKYSLTAPFILSLGTIEPRKNLLTLLEAYAVLLGRESSIPNLVMAGRRGWLYRPVFRRVRELGLAARVQFTGWVGSADLPALLNAAQVFAYPSLYEGFGLPPLEAMACGTPVISSNASSLPEVVGEGGILIPARDVGAWAGALASVLGNSQLRAELRARGLTQAQKFSWERAARATLAVYERVSANRKQPSGRATR